MRQQQQGQSQSQPSGETKKKARSAYLWISPFLRFLQIFAAACALGVMVRAGVNGVSYASFHAFRFLVGASIVALVWCAVMMLLDCIALGRGRLSDSVTPKILRIIGDFVVAGLVLSAASAAAGMTTFNDEGGFPYPQTICEGDTPWNSFCARAKAATAMEFLTFFFLLPSLFLGIARLLVEAAASGN